MIVYFLKDTVEDCVDAVIIAETSTKEDIENAIDKSKEIPDYTWEDLIEALPDDCVVYDRWNNDVVWY
jgi:hypothetical protein